jgi:hypothetical protein
MQPVPANFNYISFMARSLQGRERKYSAYSTTKEELLENVFALKTLHRYLPITHFFSLTERFEPNDDHLVQHHHDLLV